MCPIEFNKKPRSGEKKETRAIEKEIKKALHQPLEQMTRKIEEVLESGLRPANKSRRSPLLWLMDSSPSLDSFTDDQLKKAEDTIRDLKAIPSTAKSVLLNFRFLGNPPPGTGFKEIQFFKVPQLIKSLSTPIHLGLNQAVQDFDELFGDMRHKGIERTEGVFLFTTDGDANDYVDEELNSSVKAFHDFVKKRSITPIIVGVGDNIKTDFLRELGKQGVSLKIKELNVEVLLPFIHKVVQQVSESRPNQQIRIELTDGLDHL